MTDRDGTDMPMDILPGQGRIEQRKKAREGGTNAVRPREAMQEKRATCFYQRGQRHIRERERHRHSETKDPQAPNEEDKPHANREMPRYG